LGFSNGEEEKTEQKRRHRVEGEEKKVYRRKRIKVLSLFGAPRSARSPGRNGDLSWKERGRDKRPKKSAKGMTRLTSANGCH